MKYLFIEPIRGRTSSFALFSSKFELESFKILNSSEVSDFEEDYKFLCFDTFKTMNVFGYKFFPCDDIKILYQLQGHRCRNFIDLGKEILGPAKMQSYTNFSDKVRCHLRSYRIAKIDVSKFGTEELIPLHLLEKLYKERASLAAELYKKFKDKPARKFYDQRFIKILKALHRISRKPIKINLDGGHGANSHHFKAIQKKQEDGFLRLRYNAIGQKTGRLTFNKNTPNLYSLPKENRNWVVAREKYRIVQFDFKSFQPRLAIFSTKNKRFKKKFRDVDDIYSVFPGDRDENKLAFLAWMYSPNPASSPKNDVFAKEATPILSLRDSLYRKSRKNKVLFNTFGRPIHYLEEKKHTVFQNYITSIEADAILGIMAVLSDVLRRKKTRIMLPFHDALFLEVHDKETDLIKTVGSFMEDYLQTTFDARFPVEVKVGNNLRDLYEI